MALSMLYGVLGMKCSSLGSFCLVVLFLNIDGPSVVACASRK